MRKQMIKIDSSFGDICLLTAGMRHIINLFIQCSMESLLRIHFGTHDYKRTKQLTHPKHCFCGCFYSYECIFKMSLNKRIWKNIVMLFRGFQEIKIIPRGSFHVPKPKINGVRSCDFRPDFVTANAISTRNSLIITHALRVKLLLCTKWRTFWNWQTRFHFVAWWRHGGEKGVRIKWILNAFIS